MKKIGNFLLLFLLSAFVCAQIEVSSSVNKERVRFGELIILQISVQGVENPPQPELPRLDDFDLVYQSRYNEYLIADGKATYQVNFVYYLKPLKRGMLNIPQIDYQLLGNNFQLNGFQIAVGSEKEINKKESAKTLIDRSLINEQAFLVLNVSTQKAYLNQGIELKILLYSQEPVESVSLLKEPDFKGFYQIWKNSNKLQYELKDISGRRFRIYEVKRGVLFPLQAGQITISEFEFEVNLQGRTIIKKILTTGGQVLEIIAAGNEKGFLLPAGNLQFSVSCPQKKAFSGKPFEVNYRLEGNCNFNFFSLPVVRSNNEVELIEIKEQRETLFFEKEGFISFYKASCFYNIKRRGKVFLPPLQVEYFDLEREKLAMVSSAAIELETVASDDEPEVTKILHSEKRFEFKNRIVYNQSSLFLKNKLFWILLFLPFAFNLIFFSVLVVRSRISSDRKSIIKKQIKKKLKTFGKSDDAAFCSKLLEEQIMLITSLYNSGRGSSELFAEILKKSLSAEEAKTLTENRNLLLNLNYSGKKTDLQLSQIKKQTMRLLKKVIENE